jgi:hypothetical protein
VVVVVGHVGSETVAGDAVARDGVAAAPTERLEAEAIDLASRIAAGTARFLAVVAELDARESWRAWGCRSTAEWLGWRCGIDDRTAREHVRVARRLRDLPIVTDAFGAGRLSYSKVRAIARVATPETEHELVALARHGTAAHVDRVARGIRRAEALEKADVAIRRARRTLRWWWDDDGSLVITGRLTPEDGAAVVAVLEAVVAEQLTAERATDTAIAAADDVGGRRGPAGPHTPSDRTPLPVTGNADATPSWAEPAVDRMGQRAADALTEMAHLVAGGRTGGVKAELQVHVDAAILADSAALADTSVLAHGGHGRCHLVDGPALDPVTLDLLRCDSTLTLLIEREGDVIASGPRTPTIAASTRRAVLARDRGCAFPCCRGRRVQLHHVQFRARRGAHSTANLLALCTYHHQLLHREGWNVERDEHGHIRFTLPTGLGIDAAPRDRTTRRGLHPATAGPAAVDSAWAGERLDLGVTVAELLRRARRTPDRQDHPDHEGRATVAVPRDQPADRPSRSERSLGC